MNEFRPEIVVNVLYREFPDLAKQVDAKIREKIPASTFTDLSQISGVIAYFCDEATMSISDLRNERKIRNNSHSRKILFALIMKLYEPELLNLVVDRCINQRISKQLQTCIVVSRKTVSYDMRIAKRYYHIYSDFKNQVDLLYTKIIENHG